MLAYTIGIPLSIFAFLLIGALVGTNSPDPGDGVLPGLIAGGAAFALCMFFQNKANHALEHPETITVGCSPETAFTTVYETLLASHYGANFWSIQPNQHALKMMAMLQFDEMVCGGERLVSACRFIRLQVKIGSNPLGQTTVTLAYSVHSPQGRWKCDEGITKTTNWIRAALRQA